MGKVKSLFCCVVYHIVYNTEKKSLGIQYLYLQKTYQSQRIYSFFVKCSDNLGCKMQRKE